MGVYQGKFGVTVTKGARDSKLFINGFKTQSCDYTNSLVSEVVKSWSFYSRTLATCKNVDFTKSCVESNIWNSGVQWTSVLFRTLLNHTIVRTGHSANKEKFGLGLWGLKHPRSTFVLPYINYVLGKNRMKYIHVVRDGRDIASGENQFFFYQVCKYYYPANLLHKCDPTVENRIEFWSRLNLDVIRWVKETLEPGRVMVLRIEDLVGGNQHCFEAFADFVGTSEQRKHAVIKKAVRLFTVHADRYLGNKYTANEARYLTQAVKRSAISKEAFKFFGYRLDEWGTSTNCSALIL